MDNIISRFPGNICSVIEKPDRFFVDFIDQNPLFSNFISFKKLMPCPFTGPKNFCAGPIFLSQSQNLTAFMPYPFTGPKMFCAGPNILCQPKNLTAFCASSKTFCAGTKTNFTVQIIFLSGTKCL